MFQSIYSHCLQGSPLKRRVFRGLRKLLLRFGNPAVQIDYFGRSIEVPFNSDLAVHTAEFDTYNSNLRRLCRFVREEHGVLRMVDVGANIGDGAVLAEPRQGDALLLVEGFPGFLDVLKRNLRDIPGTVLAECYLSDQASAVTVSEVAAQATNRLVVGSGRTVKMETMDAVIERHPQLRPVGLVKVDVDGFDGRVLAGGRELLRKDQPVVFFEFHPSLWRKANEPFDLVLPGLRDLGYGPVVVYDNQGVLLLRAHLSDENLIHSLTRYARLRRFFYFDLAVFPESQAKAVDRFMASESSYFDARPDGESA